MTRNIERYLTNTSIKNEARCLFAAEKSGLNVEFLGHPMPKDYSDLDQEYYFPEALIGQYGSLYTNEEATAMKNFLIKQGY